MNDSKFDWDAIRVFLAVAELQSLSAAAKELSLSQPTVGRQIGRLEDQLNLQLFDRRQTGYRLTDGGKRLIEVAREMARGAADFERAVDLEKSELPDQVCRITLGEWGQFFLSQHASELVHGLAGVRLEFYADDDFWDLSRNSADIAVGNRPPKQSHLIAQKLGDTGFHVYASEAYCQFHPDARDQNTWPDQIWAGYCGTRARLGSSQLLNGILKTRQCRFAVNNSVSLLNLLLSGQAMGILPGWIGETQGLLRLSSVELGQSESWISFHERLRLHPALATVKDRIATLYRKRIAETTEKSRDLMLKR
ncbi:MAG: LysR family transcriptional regulator [Roseibium sp.]|uniref:LysR family transcriptional regulator n=1 Tax=Roseibium sp. TaxID=1936156 RepID=UPI00260E9319|nr:LysR family transcriptional regulator [Roseibium sp.]MCV0425690.1 LysR family transcriptional regulator [Roseibium sp.]